MWKDVVGENLDFQIAVPNWKDLPADKAKELKELEDNILTAVGPSFKVLENKLKGDKLKKEFVQK